MAKMNKTPKRKLRIKPQLALQMYDLMIKSRVLEERLIKIYKAGEGFFWIGGPGEEAFGVALGLLIKKGQGVEYDYLHLHYRCSSTLVTLGMQMDDAIRMMMNRATDPCSGGRNFSGHYCFPEWNVVPVSSPIEVQYLAALGTAHIQRKSSANGITIVTGGDAGTAEGDFASSLVWASRPKAELPMLITVQNNRFGISTTYESQHGEKFIADRGKAFGIKTMVINGNDPVEAYLKLSEAMAYVRRYRKPLLLEAKVSRLYGHSSASGANLDEGFDCLTQFEKTLKSLKLLDDATAKQIWDNYEQEGKTAQEKVRAEASPVAETIWDHVYANQENSDWRKF